MPIDTAADRRSAGGMAFLPLGPGVTPDAAKPLAWRQQSAWGYSGIAIAGVVLGTQLFIATQGASGDTYSNSATGDTYSKSGRADEFKKGGGKA